jgi:nucleoside-diphosphate-sugar epimerase
MVSRVRVMVRYATLLVMRKRVVLVTGANGEIGHGLIHHLAEHGGREVVALDLNPLDPDLARRCADAIQGSILDGELFARLISRYEFLTIYHLAATLSTRAEYTPVAAHNVNVQGTLNLLEMAAEQTEWSGRRVKFMFPSSIAVYGLPDLDTKEMSGRVREKSWNLPITMYGCNKAYCEHLGRYYVSHYKQLSARQAPGSTDRDRADGSSRVTGVDFRGLRFPGLISAVTVPTGGTSDYAPEMIHAAARGEPYRCFVREDTRIPFMAMPDAIRALTLLETAPEDGLTWRTYNVTSFNPSAAEFRKLVLSRWPEADISFEPDAKRQAIVDSWPADVNDDAARQEWGWSPEYDLARAFEEYLVPGIEKFYEVRVRR